MYVTGVGVLQKNAIYTSKSGIVLYRSLFSDPYPQKQERDQKCNQIIS